MTREHLRGCFARLPPCRRLLFGYVLEPGERIGMYHCENAQEAFLVLAGECTLIVEGSERPLAEWDFFYCAPRHRARHRGE